MHFHTEVHKDALKGKTKANHKTEAVGKVNHKQSPYRNFIQVCWKTVLTGIYKHTLPVSVFTATHIGEKELDNKASVRKRFRYPNQDQAGETADL